MQNGWISLHRKIRDNWIWEDPVKLKWWVDILLEVNHEPKKVNVGMQLIDCARGESIRSLKGWADRWNVSKSCARHFLNLLQKDKMITAHAIAHKSHTKSTRLTVCKYDNYQIPAHDRETIEKRQVTPNNKGKQLNKGEEPILKLESGPTR